MPTSLHASLLLVWWIVNGIDGQCITKVTNNPLLQCDEFNRTGNPAVLPLGEAFNLLSDYGFLAFNIHVVPLWPPVNNTSLFHIVTHPVLDVGQFNAEIKRLPNKNFRFGQVERLARLHVCDTVEDLAAVFFHAFHVDGLHRPWRAFAASWKKQFLPKIYGVPAAFLTDEFNFVLIRIEKHAIVGSINGTMMLEPDLLAKLPSITLPANSTTNETSSGNNNNWRPAVDFFMRFGTHIVSNYSAGDALYQILVYNASSLINHVDLRGRLEKFKLANASKAGWIELLGHPPPVHVGKLQLLSGNRTQVTWLESRLALSTLPKSLPSSIRLLAAPVLFNHFYRQLQPRAILSMNLVSITRALPTGLEGRRRYRNILLNLLRMWEYNM